MQKHGKQETEASTPQKTVRVLDEAGNEYEATYPKRAKGLVKHGRARFTDDSQTVIILACPPNQNMILEDNTMNEQINHTEVTENTAAEAYTYEYALKQIELLTRQVDHIHLAISELGHLENEGTPCGGSAKSVAEGIADVVNAARPPPRSSSTSTLRCTRISNPVAKRRPLIALSLWNGSEIPHLYIKRRTVRP